MGRRSAPPTSRTRFTCTTAATSGHASGIPAGSYTTDTYRSSARPCPDSTASCPPYSTPANPAPRPLEHRLHGRPEGRLVVLYGQQVVPAPVPDQPGVRGRTPGRVDRHDRPGQFEGAEQVGDRGHHERPRLPHLELQFGRPGRERIPDPRAVGSQCAGPARSWASCHGNSSTDRGDSGRPKDSTSRFPGSDLRVRLGSAAGGSRSTVHRSHGSCWSSSASQPR